MVAKSFLLVKCACGSSSGEIRRDVSDDRGWEYGRTALSCSHFEVKFTCYTYGVWYCLDDEVRFDLHGRCRQCNANLSTASSRATGFRTPDHDGLLKCSSCGSTVGWAVFHCAHAGLKTLGWTLAAAASAGALGAVFGAAVGGSAAASAGWTAAASGGITLIEHARSGGDAGMVIAASSVPERSVDTEPIRKKQRSEKSEQPSKTSQKPQGVSQQDQAPPAHQGAGNEELGSFLEMPTSGASATTARQDGLELGKAASQKMAATDLPRIRALASALSTAEKATGIDRHILAGIISRESRGGAALDPRGWGDHGNGYGVMQVDQRSHAVAQSDGPCGAAHIIQGAEILKTYIKQVAKAHPDWPREQQVKGGLAAYNMGPGNVRTIDGMDVGSTGNDYSADVQARAQYYRSLSME